jgi:hypothetical protein
MQGMSRNHEKLVGGNRPNLNSFQVRMYRRGPYVD